MRIALNLASKPYADVGPALKRLRIGMATLAVASLGLGYGLHSLHHSAEAARARIAEVNREIAQARQRELGYQAAMRRPQNALVLEQAVFLNKLFDEKGFSWTAAMQDLETVLPAGVQVTAIEPNRTKAGAVILRLRVSGPREKEIDLVRNMERSRRFLSPKITGESAENSGSQGGPNGAGFQAISATSRVNFDILAEYNTTEPPARAKRGKPEADGEPASGSRKNGSKSNVGPASGAPTQGNGRQPYRPEAKPDGMRNKGVRGAH